MHITNILSDQWLASFGPDQQVVQYAPRYRLAFSFMNEDASSGESPLSWDVKSAINRMFFYFWRITLHGTHTHIKF